MMIKSKRFINVAPPSELKIAASHLTSSDLKNLLAHLLTNGTESFPTSVKCSSARPKHNDGPLRVVTLASKQTNSLLR